MYSLSKIRTNKLGVIEGVILILINVTLGGRSKATKAPFYPHDYLENYSRM